MVITKVLSVFITPSKKFENYEINISNWCKKKEYTKTNYKWIWQVRLFKASLYNIFNEMVLSFPSLISYNQKTDSFFGSLLLKDKVYKWTALKGNNNRIPKQNFFPYVPKDKNPLCAIRRFQTKTGKWALEISHEDWNSETVTYTIGQIAHNTAWKEIISAWIDAEKYQTYKSDRIVYPPLLHNEDENEENSSESDTGQNLYGGIYLLEQKQAVNEEKIESPKSQELETSFSSTEENDCSDIIEEIPENNNENREIPENNNENREIPENNNETIEIPENPNTETPENKKLKLKISKNNKKKEKERLSSKFNELVTKLKVREELSSEVFLLGKSNITPEIPTSALAAKSIKTQKGPQKRTINDSTNPIKKPRLNYFRANGPQKDSPSIVKEEKERLSSTMNPIKKPHRNYFGANGPQKDSPSIVKEEK